MVESKAELRETLMAEMMVEMTAVQLVLMTAVQLVDEKVPMMVEM